MKKKLVNQLLYCVLFVLLLTSCNLGSKAQPLDESTDPDQIAVDAAVASTLVAMTNATSEAVEVLTPVMTNTPEITNTPVITSTPLPTQEPTATLEPTIEPTVTATPDTGPLRGQPSADFLTTYFDAILRGDYVSAWNNLTREFKINKHDASYANYVEGYEKMNLCDIEISNAQVLFNNGSYAQIGAHYVYVIGDDCVGYPYDFVAHFNYDPDLNLWLLDGLTTWAK